MLYTLPKIPVTYQRTWCLFMLTLSKASIEGLSAALPAHKGVRVAVDLLRPLIPQALDTVREKRLPSGSKRELNRLSIAAAEHIPNEHCPVGLIAYNWVVLLYCTDMCLQDAPLTCPKAVDWSQGCWSDLREGIHATVEGLLPAFPHADVAGTDLCMMLSEGYY